MSNKAKTVLLIWSIIVIIVAYTIATQTFLKPRFYNGEQVEFITSSGYYLDINSEDSNYMESASSEYFRIIQNDVNLFGIPQKPPLGYGSEYFYLEAELSNGRWEIMNGSLITFEIESNNNEVINIVVSPTKSTTADNIFLLALLSFFAWLVGSLILGFALDF